MNAFQFQTVPTIISEFGAARQLGALLRKQYPAQVRLCVVTDGFLHKSGLLAPALADLARHGWQVTVIDDVVADPPESVVLDAAERARQADAEVVLGLGGGSSMDVAAVGRAAGGPAALGGHVWRRESIRPAPASGADADDRRHRFGSDGGIHRDDRGNHQDGRGRAAAVRRSGDSGRGTDPGTARRRHGLYRHRRHGACHRGLHLGASEEPGVGHAGHQGAGAAVPPYPDRVPGRRQ